MRPMNKIHVLVISSFMLTSCFALDPMNQKEPPKVPTDYSANTGENKNDNEDQTHQDPATPQDPETLQQPEEITDYIECVDLSNKYYVGETFKDIYRATITLVRGETKSDLTYKPSHFSVSMKDPNGDDFDATKPFKEVGTYKYKLVYAGDNKITSKKYEINVLASPTKILNSKTTLPSGFTYDTIEASCLDNLSFPTKGDVSVLVIPIEISDYPFTSSIYGSTYREKLDILFNGDGETDTGYWESVKSFYKKASGDLLNLEFDIAETYSCGYSTSELITSGINASATVGWYAVNNFKTNHGSSALQKYDNDNDGFLDGVWFVYSAPDYGTGVYGGAAGSDLFWAFCTDIIDDTGNLASPELHSFGWASISFMEKDNNVDIVDAHTFIHETGHLLSLPDYYTYDGTGGAKGPLGGLAMMDLNIGDQDAFSKMALGWANPYVPTEDCIIELRPNEASGDCILLANNWNGTAFDEYILLDLVTPTGVNHLDSTYQYPNRPYYYKESGIRALHIDARLAEFKMYYTTDGQMLDGVNPVYQADEQSYYLSDETVAELSSYGAPDRMSKDSSVPFASRTSGYQVVHSNSSSRAVINQSPYKDNRLITLVGSDNELREGLSEPADDECLFKAGSSWTLNGLTARFFGGDLGKFTNNDDFSYVFSVLSCSNLEARVQIRKIG